MLGIQGTFEEQAQNAFGVTNKTSYTLRWDEMTPKVLQVDFITTLEDNMLYMVPGADHIPGRWSHFVHDLNVETMDGQRVTASKNENGSWKLDAKKGDRVHVFYDFHLDHEDYQWNGGLDGVAYTRDWGNFYAGRTLFVVNGNGPEEIEVNFDITKGYTVTNPWQIVDEVEKIFIAQNQADLVQSMFFIGKHDEFRFTDERFELIFALGGNKVIADRENYQKMARGVLEYYTKLMGGLPKIGVDGKQSRSVVIINESDGTDGEVIGNNISIQVQYNDDPMSQMLAKFIFAHEFFHLWNGKSFLPADDRTEWFKEGFSNYYTLKALTQCGFLDEGSFLGILNSLFYQRYSSDDGLGKIAMVQGEEKHGHWGLIYAGGLFTSLSQDMMIRNNTDNKNNLDDLMRGMYKKYAGTSKTYDLEELKSELSRLSQVDQKSFFDQYITGYERIPVETYLSQGPFQAEVKDGSLLIQPKSDLTQLEEEILEGFYGRIKN
ncbi:MAG: hypothetical protein Tsb004_29740 [Allomuricauda sp.]